MYSPKIMEEHIPALYRLAKRRRKPMTVIVNEIIGKELELLAKFSCSICTETTKGKEVSHESARAQRRKISNKR